MATKVHPDFRQPSPPQAVVRTFLKPAWVGLMVGAYFVNNPPEDMPEPTGLYESVPRDIAQKAYVFMVGFCLGYFAMHILCWTNRKVIRFLLTYRGWIYYPRATCTKLWGLALTLTAGSEPHFMDKFEGLLPPLPVPKLEDTCVKYLKVAQSFLTDKDFEKCKTSVEKFKKNEGPRLQNYLEKRALIKSNWLYDWWMDAAYLIGRDPLPAHSNIYFCTTLRKDVTSNQLARAANLLHGVSSYNHRLRNNKLHTNMINESVPFCMETCRKVLSTVRIPGEYIDTLLTYPESKHCVVYRNGIYIRLELYKKDMTGYYVPITLPELRQQLQVIYKMSDDEEDPASIASMTALRRDKWAKNRARLLEGRPENEASMRDIEEAVCMLTLETEPVKDSHELSHRCMTGDGRNRWFDKSFTIIVFPGGEAGANMEHACADGTNFSVLWEYMMVSEKYDANGDVPKLGEFNKDKLITPKRLHWNLEGLEDMLDESYAESKRMTTVVDLEVYQTEFGKGWIKKKSVSPDGFIQMALQLAYYRIHRRVPKTYESASTRFFALGRTETIHSISDCSKAWVEMMDDPAIRKEDKLGMLKRAIRHHTKFKLDACNGLGCDRHLLGLLMSSREMGMELPEIFMDKAWQTPYQLSTSQNPIPLIHYGVPVDNDSLLGGFGAPDPNGYGAGYLVIGEDLVSFTITTWESCETTSAKQFAMTLHNALGDMQRLF